MKIEVSQPLEKALDLCWQTLAECFEAHELLMKQTLVEKYFPQEMMTVGTSGTQ
jgi:V/A-type H+-transporting ATPase subunit B